MRETPTAVTRIFRAGAAMALAALVAGCVQQPGQRTTTTPTQTAPERTVLAPGQVDPNGPVQVALLVPTGSGNAERDAIGRSLEQAARLAVADASSVNIQLQVIPTGGNAGRAGGAAAQAIAQGADVIVGPLFSTSVAQVGPTAQAAGVPVFAFSNNPAVAGQNVYILGKTFEDSAARMLSFAAAQGRNRAGVIYTQDAEGQAALNAVQAASRRTNAQLVASASYPRSREGIPAAGEAFTSAMTSAGANAVVMSDRGTGLIYAASFLPFYGLDVDNVQVMGLQELSGGAIAAERALDGAWYTVADPARAEAFAARYASRYGSQPHPLAGLAYDGIAAVAALIAEARQTGDFNVFAAQNITSPAGFAGVEGAFRFRPDGGNERALAIMEVSRDGPQLVDPAPAAFGLAGF
ncbi:penicillin-binding protein activator [Pontivivens ytuae]|uniref:Penicillin-binding protein activator n=1 Tax=Pontivivens ytuae TaxID=2789856 RepID=A0A7S9LP06_9RHOB|nr:penicillin-binding protein activator [Pontivivens ytuae]QPH52652.1 penicillin-binding protein activator [Pontivivens ytuae]